MESVTKLGTIRCSFGPIVLPSLLGEIRAVPNGFSFSFFSFPFSLFKKDFPFPKPLPLRTLGLGIMWILRRFLTVNTSDTADSTSHCSGSSFTMLKASVQNSLSALWASFREGDRNPESEDLAVLSFINWETYFLPILRWQILVRAKAIALVSRMLWMKNGAPANSSSSTSATASYKMMPSNFSLFFPFSWMSSQRASLRSSFQGIQMKALRAFCCISVAMNLAQGVLDVDRVSEGYFVMNSFFMARKSTSLTLRGGKSAHAKSSKLPICVEVGSTLIFATGAAELESRFDSRTQQWWRWRIEEASIEVFHSGGSSCNVPTAWMKSSKARESTKANANRADEVNCLWCNVCWIDSGTLHFLSKARKSSSKSVSSQVSSIMRSGKQDTSHSWYIWA